MSSQSCVLLKCRAEGYTRAFRSLPDNDQPSRTQRQLLGAEMRMTVSRGREGRLKPQHASLYPGLSPGVWLPVETLIRHVTDLIHRDPSRSRTITGPRLLHQDHFEYRGRSSRPEGLPPGATRMSDAGADPGSTGPLANSRQRNPPKPTETTE